MSRQIPNQLMQLSYPQHVAEFPTYEDAQAAVDYLADKRFAVQNILIVGTNLKMLERVTGRRTWGTVLGQGAISGVSTGLFVGLMLLLFIPNAGLQMVWVGLALGVAFGVLAGGLGYAMSGGRRDFNSARLTVVIEVVPFAGTLTEHDARRLAKMRPGARAALFE